MQLTTKSLMSQQAKTGLLAKETSIGWAWGKYVAVFPAGTLCRTATNLPADPQGRFSYWIEGNPSQFCNEGQNASKEEFESWKETYGFRVLPDEVFYRNSTKKKKR